MAKLFWKIDEKYQVEVKPSFTGNNRVLVNGVEVAKKKVKAKTAIPFTLEDGREAEMTIAPWGGLAPERELRVQGQLILSSVQLAKISCQKCGKKVRAGDKFCEKCGAELPSVENQLKFIRLREARNTIGALAIMFLIFGALMYFIKEESAEKSLKNLSTFQINDIYPELIDGKQYTVAELKKEISQEPMEVLATNVVLCLIMFGLYLGAKKAPLVAIITAAAVYAAVNVLNAIIDPKTIGQGIIMKILIIGLLAKGIRSALELRKADS